VLLTEADAKPVFFSNVLDAGSPVTTEGAAGRNQYANHAIANHYHPGQKSPIESIIESIIRGSCHTIGALSCNQDIVMRSLRSGEGIMISYK
jgi:hypothetical protein